MLRFRAVIAASLAIGTTVTNTGVVTWNTPQQTASASVSIDVGGMPGVGVAERHGPGTTPTSTARSAAPSARSRAGSSSCYRNGQPLRSVLTDAERRPTASPACAPNDVERRPLRAPLPRAGRGREHRLARQGRLRLHERSAADQRHRGVVGRQPAGPQPADRPERRGVRRDRAGADRRRDAHPARRERRPAAAGGLLRRSGPAGPGHARRRLLQVRPELLRPGLPERRQLPDRGRRRPGSGFVAGYSQIIPPISGASTAAALRARVPAAAPTTRCRPRRQHCEAQPSELAPPPSVPPRTAGHELPRAPVARRQPGPGLEPDLQQPHPARPGARRRRRHHQDDAVDERQPRPARALRDHASATRSAPSSPDAQHRGPLPGRLPLRGGLRADRRRADRADASTAASSSGPTSASATSGRRTLQLLLAVGAGVSEGEYVNRAQARRAA